MSIKLVFEFLKKNLFQIIKVLKILPIENMNQINNNQSTK